MDESPVISSCVQLVVYSIKDIENLCGIKAHTLRIWEKRYGILIARRTDTNIRFYTEEDLRHALNISILYRKGFKISKLAKLGKDEIRNKVAEISEVDDAFEKSLDTLSISMLELDEYKFSKILNKNISQNGFEDTMETVIYPLLEKINLMWVAGSINEVHEAFVLNIIKHKLIVEIDNLPIQKKQYENSFLLYLPKNESQKLSLYYMYYILKKEGFNVFFLGDEISIEKILTASELLNTEFVFTIINDAFADVPLQPYVDKICDSIDATFLVSGFQALSQSIVAPKNCFIMPNLDDIMSFIVKLKEKIIH